MAVLLLFQRFYEKSRTQTLPAVVPVGSNWQHKTGTTTHPAVELLLCLNDSSAALRNAFYGVLF